MNKTTTLVLAAIAGFGLSAQARTTTNGLWTVNFEGVETSQETGIAKLADLDASAMEEAFTDGAWTVQSDDDSYVTNAVGATGPNRLELDTQGNDLTWTPTSTGLQGNRSITEMDVRFVAADDAPDGFDATTVQTAFFVQNIYTNAMGETEDDPQFLQLYAWTQDVAGNSNHWEAIGAPFAASFADAMHHVQILIDYRDTVNNTPYLHVAVDGTEVTGDNVVAANMGDTMTTGKMTAVSFKGTGTIDNFTGTRLYTDFAEYDFTAEVYMDGEYVAADSQVKHAKAGDYDDATHQAVFADLPVDDAGIDDPTYSLARVVIVDLSTGNETTYAYTYDKVNYEIVPVSTACPVLDVDGGLATLSPYTYGATNDSVIAKLYYNTLDAYFAGAAVNVGEDSARYEKFVKPSDAGTTVSWTFPNTTNGTYVLRSVVVANGATFDSSTGVVSFEVPVGGIGADKTYVTATYVEGDYSVPESYEWTYDENTGTYTHAVKTFTVTWVSEGATLATYTGVPYGTTTNYVGETPTKASAGGYDYTFAGWSPAVGPVTANTTYTAQFDGTLATIIVISANGATTNGYETLPAAFAAAADGETVALLANVNLDGRVFVNAGATPTYSANGRYATSSDNRSLTLDLNGHCITNSSNIALAGGSLTITNTSDTASVIATTASGLAPVEVRGTGDLASKRTLAVGPNVTLSGPCYGLNVFGSNDAQLNKIDVTVDGTVDGMLFVLGNLKNTANEINVVVNGTVDASNAVGEEKVHTGIAQAGYSTVTVNDGAVVTGESGIETRAGSLVVNGGTITATAPASSYEANGSGMTTKGAAIAVAQHGTALPMATTLNGGTLSGAESIVVTDVNDNNLGNVEVVATETFAEDATVPEGYSWIEDEVTGDYVLTKVWVVTYANYDGTALQVTTNVTGATTPAYAGATPVKPDDATYTYAFTGWSPAAAATVTADATYTAQFSATEKPQGTILVISANGAVTNLSETLAAAVAAVEDGGKIVLTDDQNAGASRIQVSNKSFTVDLNGQTLSSSEADNIIFRVSGGQTIQIEGTTPGSTFVGSVMIAGSTEGHIAVNGGTYTNDLYCPFYANGTCSAASSIAITNATIVAVDAEAGQPGADSETGFGLYVAGPAATTLKDTTIVADKTGVEIRAGSLVVDGGSITAGDTFSTAANGNGGTVYGAAISVSPHNTNKPIAVEVNGGTFTAAKAVYENYLQPQARTAETAVTLNGGSFIGEVDIVEDIGTVIPSTSTAVFSDANAEGVAEGYALKETEPGSGRYTVAKTYVVTYANYDGAALQVTTNFVGETTPAYAGATPVKPADASGVYEFTGFGTVAETVTADATYTAQFSTTSAKATVISIADGSRTYYPDLASAIAAAAAGDTVKMLADCNTGIGINAGTNIVLDLGGYTLSNPSDCPIWPMSGTLVVSNGTIRTVLTGSDYAAVYVSGGNLTLGDELVVDATVQNPSGGQGGFGVTVAKGGTVTVDGATINAREMCVFVASQGGATVNVVDGTLTSTDNAVVGGYGTTGWGGNTINVSGGTLNASIVSAGYAACGIYAPNDDTVNISGGTINVTNGAGVVARAGSVNITGGTITTTGSTTGKVGDSRVVVPCAAVVFDSQAAYPGYDSSSASVVIDGGTFVSDVTTVQQVGDDEIVSIPSTSTAVFSDADAEGVEDGYALKETEPGSGLYTVAKVWTVVYENYDGTALQTTTAFDGEATPAYAGATPVKPSDSQYDYTFTGWSPAVAATVTEDATYVAQFSAKENGTVIVITDNGATTNYFATLQAALDDVKENNLQQANIELLADATITISKDGNVLGGNSTTNITINGNDHALHVVRDGTWAQFNTANGAKLVLNDVSLTSEFVGTQTGWVGDTLQNPNHNIAFNCDVELKDVDSDTALSFWKDADLDTVTIAETVDVYSIWIHTTASNIAIKDLVVDSPNGRGIKVDDTFVKFVGTPSASTAISIDGASFTTKNRKAAVLVRSAYPIAITTDGTIDISNVPADTQHLVWVDVDASENFGLVTLDGGQSDLGVEGGASSYAASLTTNAWIAGYYKVLADAVEVATSADTVTLLKENAETFTVSKELTITRNGFSAENVTAGEGYQRTVTDAAYVFAEESQEEGHIGAKSEEGFYILAPADGDYDETQPLTFEAPDLANGTVAISASMVCPDGVTEVTLTLLYKTDLTASTYSRAQVTVTDIDPVAGTATVELPSGLGDTVFFFGFSNEAGVVDTTPEP